MLIQSGCKINVGLRICAKRSDGYHQIESLFVPIPLFDTLEIIPSKKSNLTCYQSDFDIPKENNLVWKSYQALKAAHKLPALDIHLIKNIPSGGGIGGGSGNVGFFIKTINQMFDLGMKIAEMEAMALSIGSDCPFFIENKPALVLGRGDVLVPYYSWPKTVYAVLLFSDIQIGTMEAYAGIVPKQADSDFLQLLAHPKRWKAELRNDFEPVVYGKFPELERNINELYALGAFYASLSGTGGCQYALFNQKVDLPLALQAKSIWSGWLS